MAASLPPDTLYVGFETIIDLRGDRDTVLSRQLKAYLVKGDRQLKALLMAPPTKRETAQLASFGLRVTERCAPIDLVQVLKLCDVERREAP